MPREPPATLLCLSMTIGARQGRNFSLNFSSCITVDKVQLQSLDQHSLGTRREHVDLLPRPGRAPSTAVQRKQLCIFLLASLEHAGCSWNSREKRAEPVWEGTLFKMAKAAEEAAAECLGHMSLRTLCCRCKLQLPQVALSCTAMLPSGMNCASHVVLKDRSPSYAFRSV